MATEEQIIAKYIKTWIQQDGRTIKKIAALIGINRCSLEKIVRGDRPMRFWEALAFFAVLDLEVEALKPLKEDFKQWLDEVGYEHKSEN